MDGSQHLEQHEYDHERTIFLQLQGYQVLQFWTIDVMNNLRGVITAIQYALKDN